MGRSFNVYMFYYFIFNCIIYFQSIMGKFLFCWTLRNNRFNFRSLSNFCIWIFCYWWFIRNINGNIKRNWKKRFCNLLNTSCLLFNWYSFSIVFCLWFRIRKISLWNMVCIWNCKCYISNFIFSINIYYWLGCNEW